MVQVYLAEDIKASVVDYFTLKAIPRLMLSPASDGVYVGTASTYDEHDQALKHTYGAWDCYATQDGIQFNAKTGLLESIFCALPHTPVVEEMQGCFWLNEPFRIGSLHFPQKVFFDLYMNKFVWINKEAKYLVSLIDEGLEVHGNKLRLRITQDFDLFFTDFQLCGWCLSNPCYYLTTNWGTIQPLEDDMDLAKYFYRYFQIDTDDNADGFLFRDENLLKQALAFRDEINLEDGSKYHRQVIRQALEKLMSDNDLT